MKELYSIEQLREMANKLIRGNSRVVNFQQMISVFDRYGKRVVEVEKGKYKLINLWEV